MLCKIAGNTRKSNSPRTACHYLFPIEKKFLQTVNQETEAVSTDSAVDIVTIWGVNSEFSASVDYRLYRNCDEEDPVYNYFSIEASVQIDPASGHLETGIDLYYDGTVNMGPFGQYPSTAGFAEIPIRFYFQD